MSQTGQILRGSQSTNLQIGGGGGGETEYKQLRYGDGILSLNNLVWLQVVERSALHHIQVISNHQSV
jgi:hypothetical protein